MSATAYIYPGQGSQHVSMGLDLYEKYPSARDIFDAADQLLGFPISKIMFEGSAEDLKQTKVTQPAIYIHSVALSKIMGDRFRPDVVAGHSLGEFSALTAADVFTFEEGLALVYKRALAMQKACEGVHGGMAAVLGLEDAQVEKVCRSIDGVVAPANYNCPGQLVISGESEALNKACEAMKAAGAKRAILLPVGGAFHSPLMEPAREELATAIANTHFRKPACPIYQNVSAQPTTDEALIKEQLILQLTAPVRWTQTIQQMALDGITRFVEVGPGNVLCGLAKKIKPELECQPAGNAFGL